MIEISHQQARRLIRRNLDGHLPEEQWNSLQAHLETCAECSAYRSRLSHTEKNIRRALKTAWNVVPGPETGLPEQVVRTRRELAAVRRKGLAAAAAAAVLAAFYLAGGFNWLLHPASPAAPLAVTEIAKPTATPVPTLTAGEFRGVVAYDSATRDGGTGVFLLNPGAATGSGVGEQAGDLLLDASAFNNGGAKGGAQDSDPAWSPDGEWIALLSARGSGKKEVFVSNVAGSRMVQLTDEPDVTWEGPLSWSADGQWIALTGIRAKQGNQRWVYRVPVNGSGPVAVDGSRNGYDPEYAPAGDRLAYLFSDGAKAGLAIQNLDGTDKASADWLDNSQAVQPAAGSGIDWSADGTSIAYIAGVSPTDQGGTGSASQGERILAARNLNYSVNLFYDLLHNFEAAASPWPGAYRGVAWAPYGGLVYLENVDDSRAHDAPGQTTTGCWTLQVRWVGFRGGFSAGSGTPFPRPTPNGPAFSSPGSQATPGTGFRSRDGFDGRLFSVSGLCVESGIDRSSWTADGQWLVVLGRTPEEMAKGAARGIYAVHLPRPFNQNNQNDPASGSPTEGSVYRLAAVDSAAGIPHVRPTLKRTDNALRIDPQPVQKRTVLSNSDLRLAPGLVYFSHPQGSGSVIVSMSPDGTGGKTLFGSDGTNRCPSPSPDGSWVAFTSDRNSPKLDQSGPVEFSYTGPASGPAPDLTAPTIAVQSGAVNGGAVSGGAVSGGAVSGGAISGGNEIYLMDTNGSNITQLSGLNLIPQTGASTGANLSPAIYDCPVWSTDGKDVAALVETASQWYLAVFALENGKPVPNVPARYAPIGKPVQGVEPRWAVNDSRVIVAQVDAGETVPSLQAVYIPKDTNGALYVQPIHIVRDWNRLDGLDISADGLQAVAITLKATDNGSIARLERFDTRAGYMYGQALVGIDSARSQNQANMVNWGVSGNIDIILQNGSAERYKSIILRYDSRDQKLEGEFPIEDTLYNAAWSPDGLWVIYTTESGLWVANMDAVMRGQARPVWISPEPVYDLAWK